MSRLTERRIDVDTNKCQTLGHFVHKHDQYQYTVSYCFQNPELKLRLSSKRINLLVTFSKKYPFQKPLIRVGDEYVRPQLKKFERLRCTHGILDRVFDHGKLAIIEPDLGLVFLQDAEPMYQLHDYLQEYEVVLSYLFEQYDHIRNQINYNVFNQHYSPFPDAINQQIADYIDRNLMLNN